MDLLFKPRVEATEQMAQNCTHSAIQESKRAQNHVQVTCTITVCRRFSLFQFYFTPGNPSWGNLIVESSSASFFRYRKNITKCTSENIWRKCLKQSFSPNLHWILIGKYLIRYFYEGLLRTKYRICIYPCYVANMNAMRNKSISKHVINLGCPIKLKDVRHN